MPNWKKVIVSGSSAALTSVTATSGFTGSLLGTASFATTSQTASYVLQAVSASFATTSLTSSLALRASGSLTGSLLGTASFATTASIATSASYVTTLRAAGSTNNVQYNSSGVLGGSSRFTFDGSTVSIAASIFASGSIGGIDTLGTIGGGKPVLFDQNGTVRVQWVNGVLGDISGVTAIYWDAREAYDTAGNTSINWDARAALDSAGNGSIDWEGRRAFDSAGNTSISWENRAALDSAGNGSIDWEGRRAFDSAGNTSLDWENAQFYGTASLASTASYVNPLIQDVIITGSFIVTGSTVLSGSLRGNVSSVSIASQTASINLGTGNFFTLTLANATTTHIAFTNIRPGKTANIRVTQGSGGNGVVSFPSVVKQPSGSAYTGSQVANAIDIISLVTFDSTDVYVNSVRRLI